MEVMINSCVARTVLAYWRQALSREVGGLRRGGRDARSHPASVGCASCYISRGDARLCIDFLQLWPPAEDWEAGVMGPAFFFLATSSYGFASLLTWRFISDPRFALCIRHKIGLRPRAFRDLREFAVAGFTADLDMQREILKLRNHWLQSDEGRQLVPGAESPGN